MAYANILFPFIFNVHISQKSPIMKIPARCQFCLLTQFKTCFSCGDKLGLWNTSMPHPFSTTTREKKLFNEPLYIVTIKRFLEISFTSGDQRLKYSVAIPMIFTNKNLSFFSSASRNDTCKTQLYNKHGNKLENIP